jgi:hypothetical protein
MKLFKGLSKHDLLYGGLISTFVVLYGATAFVSWYHAITFFNIANAMWLSVILSFVAEIGQASVLFSILLTELKKFSHVLLSWTIMILLTTLQVIGNVVSSYEWIITHGGAGVESFQKSILFWMAAADPEIFKVVIAWITGALLPIIALSMTALVAQYMELKAENVKTHLDVDETKPPTPDTVVPIPDPIPADIIVSEVSKIRLTDEEMESLAELLNKKKPIEKVPPEEDGVRGGYGDMGISEEEKKTSIEPIQFKSPGISVVAREINHSPSIEEILADLSPEAKQYMKDKLNEGPDTPDEFYDLYVKEQEKKNRPDTSDEIHKEWTKMYDDIHKELAEEEVPPPDQLTDQEVIPHYSEEEVREMFMDEWERKGTDNDEMDEDTEMLTPLQTEEEIKKVVSEVGDPPIVITHKNGLVEEIGLTASPEIMDTGSPIPGYIPEPLPSLDPLTEIEEEEKKRQEEARVERLRQIARDNLKKK